MQNIDGDLLETLFKEAIDVVLEGFAKRQDEFIFKNQQERFSVFFPLFDKENKSWKKSKNCIYKGCQNKSVNKSHTLTRNFLLSTVSENGKVCTPRLDIKNGQPKVERIGIGEASTFPGFCKYHENLFSEFEQKKRFDTSSEIFKQIYRSVCREIVVKQHRIESYQKLLKAYLTHRNEKLHQILKEQPFIQFLQMRGVKSQNFSYKGKDIFYDYLKKEIETIECELENFKALFYDRLHDELEDKSETEYFWGYNIHINQILPVALSGRASFVVDDENRKKPYRVELILNVLPNKDQTIVSIFSLKEHEEYIHNYLEEYLKQDFGLLNMIESWMVHGSDHWFLKPTVWQSITPQNKKIIIDEIQNTKLNIGTPFSKTIFNKLKRDNLENLKGNKSEQRFEEFLKYEDQKFTDVG